MKARHRLLVVPMALLCGSAYLATGNGYKYKAYTDPIVYNAPFHFYFDFQNTSYYDVTFSSYSFVIYYFDRGKAYPAEEVNHKQDASMPATTKPNKHFLLDLEVYPTGIRPDEYYRLDFILTGSRNRQTLQLAFSRDSSAPIGKGYRSSSDPVVVTSNMVYAPSRTSFDFARRQVTTKDSYTYVYEFSGFDASPSQVLRPFKISIKKRRVETQETTTFAVESAMLSISDHGKEYESVADTSYFAGKYVYFNVESFFYAGSATFSLSNEFSLDRGNCSMRRGAPRVSRESSTRQVFMPIGTNESSSYYPAVLTFYLDGDWFSVRTYDFNPHGGVGGTYYVTVEGGY